MYLLHVALKLWTTSSKFLQTKDAVGAALKCDDLLKGREASVTSTAIIYYDIHQTALVLLIYNYQ